MIKVLQNIRDRLHRRKQRPPSVESVESFVLFQNGLDAALSFPRRRYKILRIDISAMCNLHCIYCEVGRGTKLMEHSHRIPDYQDVVVFRKSTA